jgi:hypothetical protein
MKQFNTPIIHAKLYWRLSPGSLFLWNKDPKLRLVLIGGNLKHISCHKELPAYPEMISVDSDIKKYFQ